LIILMETKSRIDGEVLLSKDGKIERIEISPFNPRESWVDMIAWVFENNEADSAIVKWKGKEYHYKNVNGLMEKEKCQEKST
jgi:hypothetical protein